MIKIMRCCLLVFVASCLLGIWGSVVGVNAEHVQMEGKRPFFQSPIAATNTLTNTTYLPIVSRPEILYPSAEAMLEITPLGGINASTFNGSSFVLTNLTTHNQRITEVTIDLRTAVFPDMVFDPAGVAGDVVAKDLSIEWGSSRTGFDERVYSSAHDGGYDVITLHFHSFDPGDHLDFSIDIDPTSIRGANVPGPNQSGSVSGLELIGTLIEVTFADGTVHSNSMYQIPGSVSGSQALIRGYLPAAPTISIAGIPTVPTIVTNPNQLLQISGEPNRIYKVTVIEGGLFTNGVPGGGFDLDPFEANSALAVYEYSVSSGYDGHAELPITLTHSHSLGGINLISVVAENPFGHIGQASTPIILQLQN